MPNTTLLYILPDVTYCAELLPTKKEFTYAIQSFRQVNGEFLDENEFLAENIDKLFSKFEGEEFASLVLPDFLFTNTIVTVKESEEKAVVVYLKKELLPSLGLTTDTHYINTFVLTQLKGESKVQISALEKSVLAPIRVSAASHNITFNGATALSWSAKSIISLEPSISIMQVGTKLYSALHYIGIDQTTVAELDEIPNIIETIKTLKGGQPSIQTIYLLSNAIVEEQLTEQLKSTLPIQQLATFKEEDAKMPSYIKHVIESGMKTLSIPEYLAPLFEIEAPTQEDKDLVENGKSAVVSVDSEEDQDEAATVSKENESDSEPTVEALPTPTLPAALTATPMLAVKQLDLSMDTPQEEIVPSNEKLIEHPPKVEIVEVPAVIPATLEEVETEDRADEELDSTEIEKETNISKPLPQAPMAQTELAHKESSMSTTEKETKDTVQEQEKESELPDSGVIDLRKFSTDTHAKEKEATQEHHKTVIKNNSGISSMLRMVFITLAVFFATVAIGVGAGLGLLKMTQEETDTPAVVVEAPEPTPEASESATIEEVVFDPTGDYTILVVNATTKAGYAGTIKTELTELGFTSVDAANAKGEYEEVGTFVLSDEEIPGLKTFLEEETELTITFDTENKKQEDATGKYDFVIVLAE